jgi:hypothetical protein
VHKTHQIQEKKIYQDLLKYNVPPWKICQTKQRQCWAHLSNYSLLVEYLNYHNSLILDFFLLPRLCYLSFFISCLVSFLLPPFLSFHGCLWNPAMKSGSHSLLGHCPGIIQQGAEENSESILIGQLVCGLLIGNLGNVQEDCTSTYYK